jgi:hypothetical protein
MSRAAIGRQERDVNQPNLIRRAIDVQPADRFERGALRFLDNNQLSAVSWQLSAGLFDGYSA